MVVLCVVFFFKQKTAYEVLRSLVGSEMCIRDRDVVDFHPGEAFRPKSPRSVEAGIAVSPAPFVERIGEIAPMRSIEGAFPSHVEVPGVDLSLIHI